VEPKGAAHSLLLYEVGGIGAPHNLSLPHRAGALSTLAAPLPIHFTVLEEKFVGRTVHQGKLTAVSNSEAGIESDSALAPLSNLKIEVPCQAGRTPGGEIYAKVVGSSSPGSGEIRIRFTSVSPELKSWLRQVTARRCSPSGSAPAPSGQTPLGI
jgi:hypothetical protein